MFHNWLKDLIERVIYQVALSRTKKGFWPSKVVGFFFARVFCVPVYEQKDLLRSMGFRPNNFSFVLLEREKFPTRFELYRVLVSKYLRRKSLKCDS